MYNLDINTSPAQGASKGVELGGDINSDTSAQRRPIKLRATRWSARAASALVKVGLTPNQVSLASAVFASAGAGCLLLSTLKISTALVILSFVFAAVCVQLRLLCNLLDGMMAVEYGKATKSGEIFNEVPDRVSDFVLLVAAGYAAGAGASGVTLGWLAAYLAIGTAYIRAFGARYMTAQDFSGPMAKQHRMFALTVGCLTTALLYAYCGGTSALLVTLIVINAGSLFTCIRRLSHLKSAMEND